MKKWKIIKKVTLIILILTIAFIVYEFFAAILYTGTYPYPALGVDVNNALDRFLLNIGLYAELFGLPIIITIILFFIANTKLKNN